MKEKKKPCEDAGTPLVQVLKDELHAIRGVASEESSLDKVFAELHSKKLSAICISGGGIRSATFGLGIIQSLAKHKLLANFDYLSTVSGGGYLGSWLSAWVLREKMNIASSSEPDLEGLQPELRVDEIEGEIGDEDTNPQKQKSTRIGSDSHRGIRAVQRKINGVQYSQHHPSPEPKELQHLREYSNYMSPRRGMLSADTWALVAIYVRNLLLNQTIFLPFIAAIFILPRIVESFVKYKGVPGIGRLATLLASLLFGVFAVMFVIRRLPSVREQLMRAGIGVEANNKDWNSDAGVFLLGVFPLIASAFFATTFWAWNLSSPVAIEIPNINYDFSSVQRPIGYFVAAALIAYVLGVLVFIVTSRFRVLRLAGNVSAICATLVGGILLWLISTQAAGFASNAQVHLHIFYEHRSALFVTVAVPIFLIGVLLSATVFVGLSSRTTNDEDREWLARFGGLVVLSILVWIILHSLALLGPPALRWLANPNFEGSWINSLPAISSTTVAILSGGLALLGGYSSQSLVREEPIQSRISVILKYVPKISAVVFLALFFAFVSYLTQSRIKELSIYFPSETITNVLAVMALSLVGLIMACFVNVNKFSLHGAYRDRLVRAYLGASNTRRKQNSFTGFDESDNFQLHRLKDQKPFHVINATVNLISGRTLAWQNRKAASFTMSPLYCGSWHLNYRHTNEYCRNTSFGDCPSRDKCNALETCPVDSDCKLPGKAIRLGTAMAISGAAANPNMGYYSSSVVTFLMSLFNIRLGWWLGNTNAVGSCEDRFGRTYFSKASPTVAVLPLLNEAVGRTDEHKRFINVTDGGHFENLALYEMVLRRCRYIFLSDGAADEAFKFGEIANAIQKCKVDLGVDIRFLGEMNILPRRSVIAETDVQGARFALAEIIYPERDADGNNLKGILLYTRPTYYGTTEPTDIRNYADLNDKFPHQSTGDQMYDEKQFEAYRKLGFLTMEEIFEQTKPRNLSELFRNSV